MKHERKAVGISLPAAIGFGLLACLVYGIGAGLRGDIGILLQPLAEQCHATYEEVSFSIAVMNLVFGAVQPAFGVLAAKRSNRLVLLTGVVLLFVSVFGLLGSHSFAGLLFFLGFVFGVGAGALAFGLILASTMRLVGRRHAMLVSGMLNAAAGLCGFVLSPTLQALLSTNGTTGTLSALIIPVALLVPLIFIITSADGRANPPVNTAHAEIEEHRLPEQKTSLWRRAVKNRTFALIAIGFTTCGFHMVIIEAHLFSQFVSDGITLEDASWAFSIYGIATVFGALLSGWLSTKIAKGKLLTFYYGFRALWVILFVFTMPKTLAFAMLFSVGFGLTGDATVSPTAGLLNEAFDLQDAATLMGVLFFCHQIGAFASAYLGGALLTATGSYFALWMIDVLLCVGASLACSRIVSARC